MNNDVLKNLSSMIRTTDIDRDLYVAYKIYTKYGFPLTDEDLFALEEKDDDIVCDLYRVRRMISVGDGNLTQKQIDNRKERGFYTPDGATTEKETITWERFSRLVHHNLMTLNEATIYIKDEVLVKEFMDLLNTKQKQRAKGTMRYDEWLYYITMNGRLAKVMNNVRKPTGLKLIKQRKLYYDDYGILRAKGIIDEGIIFKHRRLIEELDPKHRWNTVIRERLGNYFDGCKECSLVIDRDFKKAYDPIYRENYSLEGDLVTGQSCMSGRGDDAIEFYGGIKGCSVVRFETDEGKQVGRCIMYEYKGIRHFIRIYCEPDYGNYCLRLLRNEMKEGDLFGRSKVIEHMKLETDWVGGTPTMYLDGNYYGLTQEDEKYYITAYGETDLHEVDPSTIKEVVAGDCVCEHCGRRIHGDDAIWAGDTCYCDLACANEDGYYQCEECGEIEHEDYGVWIDGTFYCKEDCARDAGYECCADCGDWYEKIDMTQEDEHYYCEDCYEYRHKNDEQEQTNDETKGE